MKKTILFIVLLLISSCKKDQDDDFDIAVNENLEVEDFVYKAMNTFYYWQEDVPNLADSKFDNDKQYTDFLQSFNNPFDLFENLTHLEDRFSNITDDYISFTKKLQSISLSNGMHFGLTITSELEGTVIGYVRYVIPGSDADIKGIKRGDIFTHVNQTLLNLNNYSELLFSNMPRYSVSLAILENSEFKPTGITVTLNNTEQEEKELYLSKTMLHEGKKIGYLVYNGFNELQDDDLINVFTTFDNEGIHELVIDLRYNPGGSVASSQLFAGLIAGEHAGEEFGRLEFNNKLKSENSSIEIIDSNIHLGLSRVFFITTQNTASASEMLINGLNPYINTVQIGGVTVGKNVGSSPIYDIIDTEGTLNPNHSWMLLPIMFKIFNSQGLSNYANGLVPNISISEELGNFGTLGSPDEPLLEKALSVISGKVLVTNAISPKSTRSIFKEIQLEPGLALKTTPKR